MEGSPSASKPSIQDDSLLVDDFYFSALHDAEEIFPISDELYAKELQLQEALYSSAMSNTNSTRVKIEAIKVKNVEVDTPLRSLKREYKEIGQSSQVLCAICMDAKPAEEIFRNQNCTHSFCDDCIGRYVAAKIQENILNVKCPEPNCRGIVEPQHCRSIIPKKVFDRWENALCENLVLGSQKFYCPFKDCSAMLVDDGKEVVTASECPHCNRLFCAQCKVSWHEGMGCGEFMSLNEGEREKEDLIVMELAKRKSWRRCPKCKFYVEKTERCPHITCRLVMLLFLTSSIEKLFCLQHERCGYHFCYICRSQ